MDGTKDISQIYNLTTEQVTELKETFALLDVDKDGMVTTKELGRLFRSIGQNPTEAEVLDMLQKIDTDGNGLIDFHEFISMMANTFETDGFEGTDIIKETFNVFDKDGDGCITVAELADVMYHLGEDVSTEDVEDMIKQAGRGDGHISYQEFCDMMNSTD